MQTIPSLALLGLLIAPLSALTRTFPALREVGISGIGVAPALSAMTLYALLPVLRNGVVGLRGVNPGTLDAATGMGMTAGQRFWRVQLPLALPVWLTGIRQAAVMLVGVAAVAALIRRLIMRSVVVFPQPDGPSRAVMAPSGKVTLRSRTAKVSP